MVFFLEKNKIWAGFLADVFTRATTLNNDSINLIWNNEVYGSVTYLSSLLAQLGGSIYYHIIPHLRIGGSIQGYLVLVKNQKQACIPCSNGMSRLGSPSKKSGWLLSPDKGS